MALAVAALVGAATACGGGETKPETPTLRLDDDGEFYVADLVSRLSRGRFDLVELMMREDAVATFPAAEIEAMWGELVAALGEPEGQPRLLKVGTTPITRDDGTIGFFGKASFEMARGIGEVQVEIACASHFDSHTSCRPPFLIVQLKIETR